MRLQRLKSENCLIYEVKFPVCDAIYIVINHHKFNKIIDGHFSYILRLPKMDKNQTHSLPILNRTLNLLRCAQTYVSA